MKYTILLTPKEKDTLECVLEIVRRYVEFNVKLEPIEKTWEDELAKAKKDSYNKGLRDSQDALYTQEKLKDEYDRGYTQAIADYRKFERFFNSEGIEVFEDIRNTDGTISIDMILQYLPVPEIMARIKAYEEKKKAEEEIRVGDEVYILDPNDKSVVTFVDEEKRIVVILTIRGKYSTLRFCDAHKTGRHFDEVSQLFDKLRGEK